MQRITHTKRRLRFVSEASLDRTACSDCLLTEGFNKFSSCLVLCFCFYLFKSPRTRACFCVWIHLHLKMVQTVSFWKLHTGSYPWVFTHDAFSLSFFFSPFCLTNSFLSFTTALGNFTWLSNLYNTYTFAFFLAHSCSVL